MDYEYNATIFDSYELEVETTSGPLQVTLNDTSGAPLYSLLRPLAYTHADAFGICYAIDNRESFHHVRERWIPEINHNKPNAPLLLLGCKVDLRNEEEAEGEGERDYVSRTEGEELARTIGAMFIETSAISAANTERFLGHAAEATLQAPRSAGRKRASCTLF